MLRSSGLASENLPLQEDIAKTKGRLKMVKFSVLSIGSRIQPLLEDSLGENMLRITVAAEWDDEAGVWYVADSSLPGLVTEAPTTEELISKLAVMITDLVENDTDDDYREVPIELTAHRATVVRLAA